MSTFEEDFSFNWIDYLLIAFYLLTTFSIGIWSALRERKKTTTSAGYFLAGRSMSWYTIGLSLYMSNIGSNTFVGTAGAAASNGFGVLCYEFVGIYSLLLLAYFFVPVYLTSGVFTMPEYIQKRFGGKRLQILLAAQSLLMYIFAKLSIEVYAGSLIIRRAMNWDELPSIIALLVMTAIYTVVGGLTTVIITDAVQGIVVIAGSTALAVMSIIELGGLDKLESKFLQSFPSTYNNETGCGAPDPLAFHMLRDIRDSNYPWFGAFVGANILSAWHWCTDQLFVQRTLAARNLSHAKAGSVMAGFLKILPLLLMIIPGMISRILYTDYVACTSETDCERICGIKQGCSNIAYIEIIRRMLPQGMRGVMLAAMLAALISSITSIFNSGSTLFTLDLWVRFRPKAKEFEKMLVGRLFIVFLAVIGVIWLPVINSSGGGQLVDYAQAVTSYLTPPILSVFVLASFWSRATETGVFFGLLVSMALGIIQFVLSLAYPPPTCPAIDTRPWIVKDVHFLHFAIFLFLFSILLMVIISLLTKAPDRETLKGLTYFTIKEEIQTEEREMNTSLPNLQLQTRHNTDLVDGDDVNDKDLPQESADVDVEGGSEGVHVLNEDDAGKTEIPIQADDDVGVSGDITSNKNEHSASKPETPIPLDIEVVEVKTSTGMRILKFLMLWVCGLDTKPSAPVDEPTQAQLAEKVRQLQEEVRKGSNRETTVNAGAILLFATGCFLWGYFA